MAEILYPHLFEPAQLKGLTFKNRIIQPSMCDNMSDRFGGVTDQKIAYFKRRAAGGVGWINLGYAYVTKRGRGCTYFQVGIYDDKLIPGLRRLTDAVHEYDVRMGCQIAHAGRQTTPHYLDGLPPEAPSPIAEGILGQIPEELSIERIKEIQSEYAASAVRAREAGFDLVELHGAHGYLFQSFMSPLANNRTDEYGGVFENRLRFLVETVRAVRKSIGADFPLGYRLSGSEFAEGGITIDDTVKIVRALEAEGVDYVHVSGGSYESFSMMIAPMGIGPGQLEPLASTVKAAASIPVLSVGRYNSPELAERVLADGSADFIAMGRALLADPDLPKKALEGRAGSIRPCIACEQGCIDRWVSALDITCIGNPETGRELLEGWGDIEPSGSPQKVLVIGGGPAGLEAARVAALAGHEVTLWEGGPQMGGQVALASLVPSGEDWLELIRWLVSEAEEAGATLVTNKEATVGDISDFGPDEVIVATGARPWIPRELPGHDLDHVVDPFSALRGSVKVGKRVVIDGGGTIGVQTAIYLATQGHSVTLLGHGRTDLFDDPMEEFAGDMIGEIIRPIVMQRLADSVDLRPRRGPKRVVAEGLITDFTGAFNPDLDKIRNGPVDEDLILADTVILGVRRRPNDELVETLKKGSVAEVQVVGDANTPRTVEEAIAEGSAAARSIGGPPVSAWSPRDQTIVV